MRFKVKIMYKTIRYLIIIGVVGLISACSSTFKSNVSRFHELPPPKGETVVIVPSDPAKNTSLEFASYANMVGSYLARQGYTPAGDKKPDLIVELDYSVDDGKVMVRSYNFGYGYGYGYDYGYGFGHYSPYGYFGHYGGFGYPYFGYSGFGNSDIRSYVNYTRKLSMVIRPNVEGKKNLFEGTVESTGRSNNLAKLMPNMVQALFTNFPGVSGTTDKVVIELDKN
ncbi:MAG: lipoprotein transmembrane [Alphaproteobacteria bacterium]|nr:MAG: lipoprotein transmembrane [Alphaproteobacteria bacterium]